jgi:L1 cell adhesion molecule like protein
MEVKRIINEPTAAALAYGLDRADTAAEEGAEAEAEAKAANNVLIFDLGGGTFDVSVLTIDGGIFEVKATGGDTHLGGEDFDNNLVDHLSNELKRKTKMETKLNPRGQRRLRTAAENCKRVLSTASTSTVEVDSIQDGVDLTAVVTRAKFEQINAELFTRCMDTVKAVMTDAQMEAKDINDIVLVGGSTRIPKIQDMLQEFFGGKELSKAINPDEAVAYGAAVQGAILSGAYASATSQLLLVDVTPLSLGIETTGRVMSTLIKRNTPIPCSKTRTYTTEEDMQTAVDVLVYEGERACTDSNNMLGQFTISGIERAKRGEPQVEVTFAIDANGMLNVCAQDKVTNAKANITITNNHSRLSPEEIERMTADAEKYAKEDARLIEQIELHNEIERTVYNGLEYIREAGNTMLEAKILEFKEWLQDNKGAVTSLPTLQAKQRQLVRFVLTTILLRVFSIL